MSGVDARAGVLLAMSRLSGAGPARLGWCAAQPPDALWRDVVAGRPLRAPWSDRALASSWATEAQRLDPVGEVRRHEAAGVGVVVVGADGYPERLRSDPRPPAVLCSFGSAPAPTVATVGIVGTRRATSYGLGVAHELGAALAERGVAVVSGLALGIDAAAQTGALGAGGEVVGVVAGGLDHVYPGRNASLWRDIAQRGWLVSEVPLGIRAVRWRFPVRNRILAALSDVVVVVESNRSGGSMHTVREAELRGVTVMGVPGSIRSAASEGPNQLISEGCPPCCGVEDLLVALGLATEGERHAATPPDVDAVGHRVLEALGSERVTIDQLAARVRMDPSQLSVVVIELELASLVVNHGGLLEQAP